MGKVHTLIEEHGKRQAMELVTGRRADRMVEAASATMLDASVGEVSTSSIRGGATRACLTVAFPMTRPTRCRPST